MIFFSFLNSVFGFGSKNNVIPFRLLKKNVSFRFGTRIFFLIFFRSGPCQGDPVCRGTGSPLSILKNFKFQNTTNLDLYEKIVFYQDFIKLDEKIVVEFSI
jgi:hypothetical protein